MKFENAKAGLKKIFSAEILQVIGVPVFLIGTVLSLIGTFGINAVLILVGSFLVLAGFILMLIAFILNIVGVAKAAKDEPNYKAALIALIFGICLAVASGILNMVTVPAVFPSLVSALATACEIIIVLYVCQGTMNLLSQIGGYDALVERGRKTYVLVTGTFCFTIILNLCVGLFTSTGQIGLIVGVVLAVLAAIAEIVGYVWYLIFIKKASNIF